MASQWPAIIGTLSGASLGVVSTWLLERTRWKRQTSERWDEKRHLIYGEFLASIEELWYAAAAIGAIVDKNGSRTTTGAQSSARTEHLSEDEEEVIVSSSASRMEEYSHTARRLQGQMNIIASKDVVISAARLLDASFKMVLSSRDGLANDETNRIKKDVESSRDRFVAACRAELVVLPVRWDGRAWDETRG